jgi:hypothetical protein
MRRRVVNRRLVHQSSICRRAVNVISKLAGVVIALAVLAAPTAAAPSTKLLARVGPNQRIDLQNFPSSAFALRTTVRRLKAGTYTIYVYDRSETMNFHLVGPGIEKRTPIGFRGTKVWTIRFRPGVYRYFCDEHSRIMRGSLRVD